MSIGLLTQKTKRKIYFQDRGHCGHLEFTTGTILAIFDLPSPTKFKVNGPYNSAEEAKRDLKMAGMAAI